MAEAMTQEKTTAGPAMTVAVRAPNSHPEPMIDPSEAHMRPRKPTSRFKPSSTAPPGGPPAWVTAVIAYPPRAAPVPDTGADGPTSTAVAMTAYLA